MAQVYNLMQMDVRTGTKEIITAVQFDSASRFLDVILTDNGVAVDLTDHEVRLFANKADGTEYYADGEITAATTGRCQFELTDQMLAVAQDIEVQIITYYANVEVLQAPVFKIHVVKSLITNSAVESSNEYGALVVLYQNLYEAYDLMTTMVQNIGVPDEIAAEFSIETMWEAWEWMVDYTGNDLTELITNALANASVQGVLDVIGTASDGATASTLFGKMDEVKEDVTTAITEHNVFYRASENYKYTYTKSSGYSFATAANLICRFTAKYNGTVNFAFNCSGNYQSLIYVLEHHQKNYWEVPSLSSSTTNTSYLTGDNCMTLQYNTTSASDKKFVLDVTAGHEYLIVQEVAGTLYSIKIGYDLVTTDDIVETDLSPI